MGQLLAAYITAMYLQKKAPMFRANIIFIKSREISESLDGTDETFHLSEEVAIDSDREVIEGSDAVGRALKSGGAVTVHYTTEGGSKVAQPLRQAF